MHFNCLIHFKKTSLGKVESTTLSLIYPRLLPSNSASKYTTSSLDNLSETSSEATIRQPPRHRYNLRNIHTSTPSLARTNSSLLRHHSQSLSTDTLSLLEVTLLSLNVPLFHPITSLVISFLDRPLKIPVLSLHIAIYLILTSLLINNLLLLHLIV